MSSQGDDRQCQRTDRAYEGTQTGIRLRREWRAKYNVARRLLASSVSEHRSPATLSSKTEISREGSATDAAPAQVKIPLQLLLDLDRMFDELDELETEFDALWSDVVSEDDDQAFPIAIFSQLDGIHPDNDVVPTAASDSGSMPSLVEAYFSITGDIKLKQEFLTDEMRIEWDDRREERRRQLEKGARLDQSLDEFEAGLTSEEENHRFELQRLYEKQNELRLKCQQQKLSIDETAYMRRPSEPSIDSETGNRSKIYRWRDGVVNADITGESSVFDFDKMSSEADTRRSQSPFGDLNTFPGSSSNIPAD